MRRALARRAASCGNGRDGERARASPPISVTRAPICSAPFVPLAALAMPHANTEAMQLHLDQISATVAVGAHAVLIFERAGWHTTPNLVIPENITPIWLPSRAPELNPAENIWQYLRANWLSNRVFETFDDIIDAICEAWNKLAAEPQTIPSIGMRDWAHVGQSK